jgi:phosphatidylinositol alpha-1,6-mannosyltransferase
MRAGKACLAGPGAATEVVEHGVTGLIVDPAQRGELAGALVRLFREPDVTAAMGRAGAARVQSRFEREHFARRVIGALKPALVHA